jgi:hypothetical protein
LLIAIQRWFDTQLSEHDADATSERQASPRIGSPIRAKLGSGPLQCGGSCVDLFNFAQAIQELLRCAEWCLVKFLGTVHQSEMPPEFRV